MFDKIYSVQLFREVIQAVINKTYLFIYICDLFLKIYIFSSNQQALDWMPQAG